MRPDQLRYYAAGYRRARLQMTRELRASERAIADEIDALRAELRELRAEVARKGEIERAIETEHQGWLQ
jgi:hypothetical protein